MNNHVDEIIRERAELTRFMKSRRNIPPSVANLVSERIKTCELSDRLPMCKVKLV